MRSSNYSNVSVIIFFVIAFIGMVMYRNSKLCQILCMLTLAASLEKDDAINVNAVSSFNGSVHE